MRNVENITVKFQIAESIKAKSRTIFFRSDFSSDETAHEGWI